MQFKFDPNQEYQAEAVGAVVSLFEGQVPISIDLSLTVETSPGTIPNRISLSRADLLSNLRRVQEDNEIQPDDQLQEIEETIDTVDGELEVAFPNFSVEMETGTGKTYVYLRTALEVFRKYGLRKFVVVVPSVAIREGVLKDLQITREHFRDLFSGLPYRFSAYDSANLSIVRQFALSDSAEFLVMTIDSFNKDANLVKQPTDRLQGVAPIELIRATRPVLILDEPQNLESELSVRSLAALNPLVALRYSATHRNPYNLVHRLSPYEAYRQGLVKRIEVASVLREGETSQPFLRLDRIDAKKRTVTARVAVHKLMRTGAVAEKVITVRPDDSLEEKTGRSDYQGYEVDEISPGGGFIRFANNVEVELGGSFGADKEAIFEAQIRYTIEEHFRKQARLAKHDIKVLSLFFIDRVDNYAPDDGLIRKHFVSIFEKVKTQYPDWADKNASDVQAAYFAQKRRRGGHVELIDSVSGKTAADSAAYNLIMKDKERLLSPNEPVAFIFSHSALREGWDNPNVFQICTLNQSVSEVKKRQEVGRGMRLARNDEGERVHDDRVNVLTVVANESYERYVAQLQSEIEEEYGPGTAPPKPPNARKRRPSNLRKEHLLSDEFQQLWDRVKHKTRYRVAIDTEELLVKAMPLIDAIDVTGPSVEISKAVVNVSDTDVMSALQVSSAKSVRSLVGRHPLPNLAQLLSDLLLHTSPPVRLTRSTLVDVFRRLGDKHQAMESPYEFASAASRILKETLADLLVAGIEYEKIDEWYEMSQFESPVDAWEDYLVPAEKSLYDHVIFDSGVEKRFVEALEAREDVIVYVKLPDWFKVPTPVGNYNPDWALVLQDTDEHGDPMGEQHLYLVRETKGANWRTSLRPTERRKVKAATQHFVGALNVDYAVVSDASELTS